ncbi:lysoplasmalogenase family protein [Tabrizicola sp.]|uniref:lysoplasmalogenase family protein n=1 Tax=Tabrizicola sp. TaxID=2005166 RepID=UPI0035B1A416
MPAVLALGTAVVYGLRFATREEKGWLGAAVKTASTGFLALAVVLAAAGGGAWFWLVPLGLALGALGDLCLALKGERLFLAGVGAFGLGHLAYAGGFLLRSGALGFDGVSGAEGLVLAVLLALLVSPEVWLAPRTGGLRGPVRGYVALIGLMGVAAVLLPDAPGQGVLRAGAALFILSDLMLAVEMFVARDPRLRRGLALALWPAYWGGQALIAWGALAFWGVGQG